MYKHQWNFDHFSCSRYGSISGTVIVVVTFVIVIAAVVGLIKTKHGKGGHDQTGISKV